MSQVTAVERAFQLARSSACRTVDEIARQVNREGIEGANAQLAGGSIRKQLKALIAARPAGADV